MDRELWKTNKRGVKHLIDGGLHYGHLQMDFKQTSYGAELTLTPVYVFQIINDRYDLVKKPNVAFTMMYKKFTLINKEM